MLPYLQILVRAVEYVFKAATYPHRNHRFSTLDKDLQQIETMFEPPRHPSFQDVELESFKYIHMATDFAIPSFLWPYQVERLPLTLRHRRQFSRFMHALRPRRHGHEMPCVGCIYVFQRIGLSSRCRMTYTVDSPMSTRRDLTKCRQPLHLLYHRRVRNVRRIELLASLYSSSYGVAVDPCNWNDGCTHALDEWYEVSPDQMIADIDHWAQWVDGYSESVLED